MAIHITSGKHRGRDQAPTDGCWVHIPGASGPPCSDCNRKIRESATAQSRDGYGRPGHQK